MNLVFHKNPLSPEQVLGKKGTYYLAQLRRQKRGFTHEVNINVCSSREYIPHPSIHDHRIRREVRQSESKNAHRVCHSPFLLNES